MGSRIRENPTHVFECFCEVVIPQKDEKKAWILQKYPHDFDNEEMLKSVPEFSCPCEFTYNTVQHFSFVLTSLDSKWTFGYCRFAPKNPTVLVILSFLPWHEIFYKLLNHVAELTEDKESGMLNKFLEALYFTDVPEPGLQLHVAYNQGQKEFIAHFPDHFKLPTIPDNRNLTEYFNAIDAHNMMVVFASMLHERRIMMTSKKLSRLSACVQAANLLIYPMQWQHIFIPVLPKHLLDYLSAPMPFLIGVPSVTMMQVKHHELGDVVILDADNNRVKTPFNDLGMLPTEIVSSLKRNLKNPHLMLGDGVARAFMRALVHLIGGYRDALQLNPGEKIKFQADAFIQSRPSSIQPFLEKMLQLQIFQQFIEGRLDMLNSGIGFSDEFEYEVSLYEDKASHRLKNQYKEWVAAMKKEGGAFLKNVKSKVRDKGKRAYKDLRSKMQELQLQKHHSQSDLTYHQNVDQPKSAPSSPTMSRTDLFTIPNGDKRLTTFHIDTESKHGTLEAVNLPNSLSVSGIRRYKMLTVDEVSVASEESVSDAEHSPGIQRINMDLMGDLQDIIFRKRSLSSENVSTKENISKNSSENSLVPPLPTTNAFTDSFSDMFLPAPIPPPRTKRRNPAVSQNACPTVSESSSTTLGDKVKHDEPLLHLDPLDEDALFDPLKQGHTSETDLISFAAKPSALDSKVNELKSTLQTMSMSPMHNAPFQPSPYFPSTSYFLPRPAQPGLLLQRTPQHTVRTPNFPVRFPSSGNFSSAGSVNLGTSEVIQRMEIPPPLPPKKKCSPTSTFFVSTNNALSQDEKDLLADYGLSSSPIFAKNSSDSLFDSSPLFVDLPKSSEDLNHSTASPKPHSQVQAVTKDAKTDWKTRSSWQKF